MISLDPVVEKIFDEALEAGASDIHLEPQIAGGGMLRFRVGGALRECGTIESVLKEGLVSKLKLMARLDVTQNQLPQDGSFIVRGTQVRLSVIPALGGQSVVMRIFKNAAVLEKLGGLGLESDQVEKISAVLNKLSGLVIIAGPTGSGKTTTFYAALRAIDPVMQKIITVEDPIEQRLEGVCQVPVKGGLTFATALRSILRQSPNVIGVGELRDADSVRMALQAALTGHLVIATLHADSAAAVPARLVNMGLEPSVLAEMLSCVVAQRLLMLKVQDRANLSRGVFEVMCPSDEVRVVMRRGVSAREIEEVLLREGFVTMRERAEALVSRGIISKEQMLGDFFE